MTQGIVSIRKDGAMVYKIVVGHDGMNASKVAAGIRNLLGFPRVMELRTICEEEGFGCAECLVILEHDEHHWNKPVAHVGPACWLDDSEDSQRYYDTFHVAQFNPRWKFGTADYVEVVDL
jgi:hypothetical protein